MQTSIPRLSFNAQDILGHISRQSDLIDIYSKGGSLVDANIPKGTIITIRRSKTLELAEVSIVGFDDANIGNIIERILDNSSFSDPVKEGLFTIRFGSEQDILEARFSEDYLND